MTLDESATIVASPLTVRTIKTRAVRVPLKRPLRTSVGVVSTAPLVLIDLETDEGVTGHSYLFAYNPSVSAALEGLISDMADSLGGVRAVPSELQRVAAKPYQLVGVHGLIGIALSGIDVACRDVLCKAAGVPLATLLGGQPSPTRAYNGNGLGIMSCGRHPRTRSPRPAVKKDDNALLAWVGTHFLANVASTISGPITKQSMLSALKRAKNVNMYGLLPPWNASARGTNDAPACSPYHVFVPKTLKNGQQIATDPGVFIDLLSSKRGYVDPGFKP